MAFPKPPGGGAGPGGVPGPGRRGAYRPDIDGLRAVAVAIVVLFHYGFSALKGGFVGVDVFFVISGYLITAITLGELAGRRFSLVSFYERRIRRIVPAFTLVLLATGLASIVTILPEDLRILARSTMASAVFASNLLFARLAADYFNAANLTLEPLLHSWSLAVEGQFYLLFPLVLMPLRGRRGPTAAALSALAVLSFGLGTWQAVHSPVPAFYLLPGRAWELLLGGLLACAGPRRLPAWLSNVAVAAGLAAIGAAALVYDGATPVPGPAALLPCLGALLVIGGGGGGAGAGPAGRLSALLGTAGPAWLGRISYSLYLWHWPVIVLARYGRGPDLPFGTRLVLLGATVALAGLSYTVVERPFIARRLLPGRRALLGGAAAGTLASLALGGALDLTGRGLLPLTRLPPAAALLAAGAFDRLEGECPVPGPDAPAPAYPCRFGAISAPPTVALWGNSYARMWIPALARDAEAQGAAGLSFVFSKCPPLLGLDIPALPGCAVFNRAAAAFVAAHPEIRTVVLGADWFLYDADLGRLDATLEALRAARVRTFVLLAPPQADYPVPRTLAMAALRGEAPPPPPTEAHARDAQRVSVAAIEAAAARHGAAVLDPMARLCEGGTCPVARDGYALFYDAGHLTVRAAGAIHGFFAPLFAPETPASR